jgi:hypothetical protein
MPRISKNSTSKGLAQPSAKLPKPFERRQGRKFRFAFLLEMALAAYRAAGTVAWWVGSTSITKP